MSSLIGAVSHAILGKSYQTKKNSKALTKPQQNLNKTPIKNSTNTPKHPEKKPKKTQPLVFFFFVFFSSNSKHRNNNATKRSRELCPHQSSGEPSNLPAASWEKAEGKSEGSEGSEVCWFLGECFFFFFFFFKAVFGDGVLRMLVCC